MVEMEETVENRKHHGGYACSLIKPWFSTDLDLFSSLISISAPNLKELLCVISIIDEEAHYFLSFSSILCNFSSIYDFFL